MNEFQEVDVALAQILDDEAYLPPRRRTIRERAGNFALHFLVPDALPVQTKTAERFGAGIVTGAVVGVNELIAWKTGVNPLLEAMAFIAVETQ